MAETTSGQAPNTRTLDADAPAVAAASDKSTPVGEVVETAGVVTGVSYTPSAAVTGANTETRTLTLVNKGQAGAGTTVVATLALTSGVNMTAFDEKDLTLSVVAGATGVVAGDILAFVSTHSGSTGLADPGGTVKVEYRRD